MGKMFDDGRHEAYRAMYESMTPTIEQRLDRLERAQLPTTREMIREFNLAFDRPVNDRVVSLTVTERELLGKLILEECVEYLTKGLGLKITNGYGARVDNPEVELNEGQRYDPIESADGLGDMNVVIHFNALWHGFDLDAVTREIHRSNMSKLAEDGTPIINGVTPGYRDPLDCVDPLEMGTSLFDPSKPVGKILKGPDYSPPDIMSVLRYDESMCPGHVASASDPKVCGRCGVHVDSFRPDED